MSSISNQLKIAIIVPYRDLHPTQKRAEHLKKFIAYMGPFMEKAITQFSNNSTFHIFIVEQSPEYKFNRGALLNIGYDYIVKNLPEINTFIFQDVDIILDKIHNNRTIQHKNIPIQILDKTSWNRFFDDINLGLYPYTIVILTSNIHPDILKQSYDPSYIRDGRVHLIGNQCSPTTPPF